MKKVILALSLISFIGASAIAGGDKEKDKKACSESEKKSCCAKKSSASCEKKADTKKTEEKKPQY